MKFVLNFVIFSILTASTLFAQAPSNDECSNATLLTVGTSCNFVSGTSVNATASASIPDPSCGSTTRLDVWYRFVAPASGNVLINTKKGTQFNMAMALYSGSCGSLSVVECDDDDNPNSDNTYMPAIASSGLVSGDTYYIRIWERYGATSNFSICFNVTTSPIRTILPFIRNP